MVSETMARCILCDSSDQKLVERINVSDIAELYRNAYGVDVVGEFKGINALELMLCEVCDLRFFHPVVTGSSEFYAELGLHEWYYESDKPEFAYARDLITAGDEVLEVGCGSGHFADSLNCKQYVGLELSERALESAHRRGLNVLSDDISSYARRAAGHYDVVCSFQTLEHVSNPSEFMSSCASCLKPGGKLILSVPSLDSYLAICKNSVLHMPPHHITHWSDRALIYAATSTGLDQIIIHHERLRDTHQESYFRHVCFRAICRQLGWADPGLITKLKRHRLAFKVAGLAAKYLALGLDLESLRPVGHTVIMIGFRV